MTETAFYVHIVLALRLPGDTVGQCGPTTVRGPHMARRSIQEKPSNLKLVEKRVGLHLSHCMTCTHGRNFVVKFRGGQFSVKSMRSSGRCRSFINKDFQSCL